MTAAERGRRLIRVYRLARERLALRRTCGSRIVYLGGQGDDNLGDEAMLEAARGLLPESELVSFAYAGQERQLALLGLSGSRYFDSAILGGGTLINPHWVEATRTVIRLGLPVWTLGTGVGSSGFGHPQQVEIGEWRDLLDMFRSIGVRGPLSKARLEDLGVEPAVEVVGDLALGLAANSAVEPADPPRIALNVSLPASGRVESDLEGAIAEVEVSVRELVQGGWDVVPVAMHRSDVEPLRRLVAAVAGKETVVQPAETIRAFHDVVGPCSLLVGVRLHSAVLASCTGVPSILLGYRDKCLDFLQSMDMTEFHVDVSRRAGGEIANVIRRAAEIPREFRDTVLRRAISWKVRLEQYINRNELVRRTG